MPSAKPNLFIASTHEGRAIANAFHSELAEICDVMPWTDVFEAGSFTLESLDEASSKADFAIVIFTGEDWTRSRGRLRRSPRDNLLFEAGLFVGKLGRRRTFIVVDRSAALKIPTDLNGITLPQIDLNSAADIRSIIRPVCLQIEEIVTKRGRRRRNVDGKVRPCLVNIYFHSRRFTRTHAELIRERLSEHAVHSIVLEHGDNLVPDALFIGSMVTADELRLVLPHVTHPVHFLFRPDYPDSEGGDAEGRKIGIGYVSSYNALRRGKRGTPSRITAEEFTQLRFGSMSNAELAVFMARIHSRAHAPGRRKVGREGAEFGKGDGVGGAVGRHEVGGRVRRR